MIGRNVYLVPPNGPLWSLTILLIAMLNARLCRESWLINRSTSSCFEPLVLIVRLLHSSFRSFKLKRFKLALLCAAPVGPKAGDDLTPVIWRERLAGTVG